MLEAVSSHPRWALRYEVQLSLVQNPYTPTPLAVALAPFLNNTDLRYVMNNDALHKSLREATRIIYRWRNQ